MLSCRPVSCNMSRAIVNRLYLALSLRDVPLPASRRTAQNGSLRFARALLLTWFFALPWNASPADAAWATFGNPATLAPQNQVSAKSIPDGSGGIILVWEDYRNGDADVYANRLDGAGTPLWGTNGVLVISKTLGQESPAITSDGAGGAIVAWQDARTGTYDIYVQGLNSNGTLKWNPDGVPVCLAVGNQVLQVIAPDGAGGAIVGWRDLRTGDSDVYAQRVTNTGTIPAPWAADGMPVCVLAGIQTDIRIEADPRGGAFLVWRDRRNGVDSDIYAQSINGSGAPRWTTNGVVVVNSVNDQLSPTITYDGRFGLLVAWHDFRNGSHYDVWAQRVKPDGTPRWTANGVRLTNAAGGQSEAIVVSDGLAGAIVGWTDSRVSRPDVYAQRVDSAGVVQWTPADGVPVCASDSSQFLETGATDGLGGAIFGWDDDRSGGNEIFAQSVASNGSRRWLTGGVKVATGSGFRTLTTQSPDGFRGALFAWQDFRGGATCEVYAYRITSVGTAVEPSAAPRVAARIYPARPNPFNPSTVLEFSLEEPSTVSFALYDVQGRRVRVLTQGLHGAGRHVYRWDGLDQHGRACGSGVYFAHLALPSGSRSTSITLLR